MIAKATIIPPWVWYRAQTEKANSGTIDALFSIGKEFRAMSRILLNCIISVLPFALAIASPVYATVIDIVPVGVVDAEGTPTDKDDSEENPLMPSDMMKIATVLNHELCPVCYSSRGIHYIASMSPGSLGVSYNAKGNLSRCCNDQFSTWRQSDPLIQGNGIARLSGTASPGIQGKVGGVALVWGVFPVAQKIPIGRIPAQVAAKSGENNKLDLM